MLQFSDIKLGQVVNFNGNPCVITSCQFSRKQQRKPVKVCKLKNLVNGSSLEYSFKSGESVEEADLKKERATFMYKNGDTISFMVSSTYETVDLDAGILDDKVGYLKDEMEVTLVYFNDGVISIELPIKVSYTIIETSDVVKGNTVSDVDKEATIETGKVVRVPGFIKNGEKVLINTIEDEYAGRDNE
jgi:elongation factor P